MTALNKVVAFSFFILIVGFLKAQTETINWLTWDEVVEKRATNPKPVFVDVYTNWCGWCKKMDKETFQNANVANYVNEHFYAIKFNAEQKETVILGKDTFEFVENGRRGYHELAAAILQGKMSYPTVVFLDENINMIQPIPGYQSVSSLEPILVFIGEGKYKNTEWASFQANYKPTF